MIEIAQDQNIKHLLFDLMHTGCVWLALFIYLQ